MTKKEDKVLLEPAVKPKKLSNSNVNNLFLDSGAYSLYHTLVKDNADDNKIIFNHPFFQTDDFIKYVDKYGRFLQKHGSKFDYYVNCDAIYDPETSYKMLKYLEDEYGVNPMPVVHSLSDLKWLQRYIEEGYDLIGLGGVGPNPGLFLRYKDWADEAFTMICATKNCLPCVRIHGFAITAHALLTRYPWWSVDSASWEKWSSYGRIYIPRLTNGEFDYQRRPFNIFVSQESPRTAKRGMHTDNLRAQKLGIVKKWLEKIGVPLGSKTEWGVVSKRYARLIANLHYLDGLIKAQPDWPTPYYIDSEPTFNCFPEKTPYKGQWDKQQETRNEKVKLFYSGGMTAAVYPPERILEEPDIMITYWAFHSKKPGKRIRRIVKQNSKRRMNENR